MNNPAVPTSVHQPKRPTTSMLLEDDAFEQMEDDGIETMDVDDGDAA